MADALAVLVVAPLALCLLAPPGDGPPRVDGGYVGATPQGAVFVARLEGESSTLGIGGGAIHLGDAVFRWMTIGVAFLGHYGAGPHQRVYDGGLQVELGFLPVPRYPLSLRIGFGFGAGAVMDDRKSARSGFGGALLHGAARYEFFPIKKRKHPTRGGGFAIGPEIGWFGFTPARAGANMANAAYGALFVGYYFGS